MHLKEIDKSWKRAKNDKLTFAGVLEEDYEMIAQRWKASSTRHKCNLEYNNRILPCIPEHNSKSIDEYTKEDFDITIEKIRSEYKGKAGEESSYQDSTIQHFRHLIYLVVECAAKQGRCDHILWGSTFQMREDVGVDEIFEDRINEYVRLKKSYSIEESLKMAGEIFVDPLQRGEYMGLLLMFGLGLRNAEACGANFGDIKPMDSAPENHLLWISKTTIADTNRVKSSGKTGNADRVLPIPDKLYAFLNKRKQHLQDLIDNGSLILPDNSDMRSVDDLPISCTGDSYLIRSSTPKLTAAAREILWKIGVDGKQLAYIEVALQDPFLNLKEKEATAYLNRRNLATVLHLLGFSIAEIHYMVGHDVEDKYETRNEFVNEERLLALKEKIERHPIFGTISNADILETNESRELRSDSDATKSFALPAKDGTLCFELCAAEPKDTIRIKIKAPGTKNGKIWVKSTSILHNRRVNLTKIYKGAYEESAKRSG